MLKLVEEVEKTTGVVKAKEPCKSLAHFLQGIPGKYRFEAHNYVLIGRLVLRYNKKYRQELPVFLPFQLTDTLQKVSEYSRSSDKDFIFISFANIMGYGPLSMPEHVKIPRESMELIEHITNILQAGIVKYAFTQLQLAVAAA